VLIVEIELSENLKTLINNPVGIGLRG